MVWQGLSDKFRTSPVRLDANNLFRSLAIQLQLARNLFVRQHQSHLAVFTATLLDMEKQHSMPASWVGKEHLGFVINAKFSLENTTLIDTWLKGLNRSVTEGLYTMTPEALHITVLDWVAPLFDYSGADKRDLFASLSAAYWPAFRAITDSMSAFEVDFNETRVTPGAIILLGQDNGQFQSLRNRFMDTIQLPEGGKQPPNIIHSSLARFIAPEIELSQVEVYAAEHPLTFTQRISEFRLVETRREPMQDFTVLDTFELAA